jgi:anti-anti-sigma factor
MPQPYEGGNLMGAQPRREAKVDLKVAARKAGDVTILDLHGTATIGPSSDYLSGEIKRHRQAGAGKLLVNLRELVQIDSSGISAIVGNFIGMGREGGSLKLVAPQGRVREVLSVMRLLEVIPTFDDEAKALASFRQGQDLRDPSSSARNGIPEKQKP